MDDSSKRDFETAFGSSRRLNESTLWSEDDLSEKHLTVFGSWYDVSQKRWGYSCCRSLARGCPCPLVAAEEVRSAEVPKQIPETEGSKSSSDTEEREERLAEIAAKQPYDWDDGPEELLPADKETPAAYLEHFVRFFVASWRRHHKADYEGWSEADAQTFRRGLKKAEDSMEPLLRKLDGGKGKVAVLAELFEIARLAADREYLQAHKAYTLLTLGNKRWHNTCVLHVPACQMKGAREYRRNCDELNVYDKDPVAQRYIHGLRKIVHLAQRVRPNAEGAKEVSL